MAEDIQHPFGQGPYVQVAALCEKVLREADGVLSLVRIVDRITTSGQGPNLPADMPEFRYPLTLVLGIRAGRSQGRHDVTITPQLPSGLTMPPITMAVQMEGQGRGVNLVAPMDIPYTMEGLHWFNIGFDGLLLTRVSVEVIYTRLTTG